MSDTDTAVAAEAPTGKKRRSKKLLLVGLVIVLAGAGAGVYLSGMLGPPSEAEPVEPAAPSEGAVVALESMTTSIGGEEPGYVRVGLALVLAEGITSEAVADRFPLVQDATLSELSEYEPDFLRTPAGIEALRVELSERARAIYPDGEVLRVVFTELLVQ